MSGISVSDFMLWPALPMDRRGRRQRLVAYRRSRTLSLGPCMRLQFDDELTLRHEIQEVLQTQTLSSAQSLQQEIDAHAHLLPSGSNWKVTLVMEATQSHDPARELLLLHKAVHQVYVEQRGQARVYAQANEPPKRPHKRMPGVHFLCFEFPEPWRAALGTGSSVRLGCAHERYEFRRVIPPALLEQLRRDLRPVGERVV